MTYKMRKIPTTIQLDQIDRDRIELLMAQWGTTLSGTIRKVLDEYLKQVQTTPPEPVVKKKYVPDPSTWDL